MNSFSEAPLVSVVIPCFNDKPQHLEECLKSVLSQSYANLEIFVVDDGSTEPETIEALRTLPGSVNLITSNNRGPSAARNLGIASSSGVFILPLDADDWISPGFIAATVAVAERYSVEIAYPDVQEFGVSSRLKQPPSVVTLSDLSRTNKIAACAMFRRGRWEEVGGYDESMRRGFEDYELWVRLLRDGGTARKAPSAVLYYRQRGNSRRQADLASGDALSITRARILANNKEHVDVLLAAAWEHADVLWQEVAKAWDDPLQLRRWVRQLRPAFNKLVRRLSRSES